MGVNIYYNPEKHGLEILGAVSREDLDYEFDHFVVWRDALRGELFYASDTGCSCPEPFEWQGRDDLSPIASLQGFSAALDEWNRGPRETAKADVSRLRQTVMAALRIRAQRRGGGTQ